MGFLHLAVKRANSEGFGISILAADRYNFCTNERFLTFLRNRNKGYKFAQLSELEMMNKNLDEIFDITGNEAVDPAARTAVDKMKAHIASRGGKMYEWSIDDFDIGAPLGRGRFGRVYLARDRHAHIAFALKLLHKSEIIRSNVQRQVLREIEINCHLKHPNILNMFTYFDDKRFIYLVLEYAAGGELYRKMSLMPDQHFTEEQSAKYMYQVVDALDYCHKKRVIHRDIKPENILLSGEDNIKLSDFGWSVHAPNSTRRTMCGTLDYLPPEMVLRENYDEKVDNWCIGVLCYEFLVGQPPFESSVSENTYRKIKAISYTFPSHVSKGARDLIKRTLCKNPRDRISLMEIMNHPWILSHYQPQQGMDKGMKNIVEVYVTE